MKLFSQLSLNHTLRRCHVASWYTSGYQRTLSQVDACPQRSSSYWILKSQNTGMAFDIGSPSKAENFIHFLTLSSRDLSFRVLQLPHHRPSSFPSSPFQHRNFNIQSLLQLRSCFSFVDKVTSRLAGWPLCLPIHLALPGPKNQPWLFPLVKISVHRDGAQQETWFDG
jgi:hypothetical protein